MRISRMVGFQVLNMCILFTLIIFVAILNGIRTEKFDYVESYFDQKLDHFNFVSHGGQTYKQRYLYNDTWWDPGNGPIFFYAGNEGNIVGFWDNTGFIFKAAKAFNAMVVFAEHRYYGKSLPFGNESFSGENIGLLGIEQAMADYAFFLKGFKALFKGEKCPVIAFGGSYGGMLAAYMRFKYPNIIQGAISASAPLYLVAGKVPGSLFFEAVTKDFRDISTKCEDTVRSAFNQLDKWIAMGQPGFAKISRGFHLCNPLKTQQDYRHLLLWIRNAFVSAAMMDYPYPASFMGNFPAFPVKVMCEKLLQAQNPPEGLFKASAVFYNSSQKAKCFDIYAEYIECADPTGCGLGSDSTAWDYQACTEINLEASTTGVQDMFPVLIFNASLRDAYCSKKYKVLPRRNYLDVVLWGADISSTSNIVFSNGNLDPCAVGGVLHYISDTVVSAMVDGGAHHLDLRGDNPKDPSSVRAVRDFEMKNIQKWLKNYYETSWM